MAHGSMDVTYMARLARLRLTDEETAVFQGQLDQVLAYFEALKAADVEAVEPTAHAVPVRNVFRADEPAAGLGHEAAMANAPQAAGGLFMAPRIVE